MEWREEGVLLTARRHGENAAIIEVFTPKHGRHAGIVRGGASRKMTPVLQPGSQIDVTWRARLEDHLGSFTVEPVKSRAHLMSDRKALAGLNAMSALLIFALPERETHKALYDQTLTVLEMMEDGPYWPLAYLRWELSLLDETGFGLDLATCAVTDSKDDLVYVSPKSGRAVSKGAAGEWAKRMLPLSPALVGASDGNASDLIDGFRTTGHFLTHGLAASMGTRPLPNARHRLIDLLSRGDMGD